MSRAYILTLNGETEFYTEPCCSCGVLFAMTRDYERRVRKTGASWYCPNGHAQHYTPGKSAETKLQEAKAREVALQDQLSAAIRDAEATRAALLRDRARFAAGVCPCCNRSFENVRRHMTSQHPDYDVTRVAEALVFKCSCQRQFETFKGLRVHQGAVRHDGWDSPKASRWSAHLTEVKV